MMRALATNKLVNSPHYEKILTAYNNKLAKEGKINNKKFYEEVILPLMPDYDMGSWYYFLRRFKTSVGIQFAVVETPETGPLETPESALTKTFRNNNVATAELVSSLLNVSADAAKDILENPNLLSPEKRIELGIKIMKAQDSRIHAIGKIREDAREQDKFDRAFEAANFE